MWFETSDNYEEFHKFLQVSTNDAGLQIVIAENLHIDIMAFSVWFLYYIKYTNTMIQASLKNQPMATKVICINKKKIYY